MDAQETAEEKSVPTFYLDTFPKEFLGNVLCFFRRIPKIEHRKTHIPLLDLIPLFRVNGQVGSIIKTRFTALCVSRSRDCISETNIFPWEQPPHGMLRANDINIARAYVLAGAGKALSTRAVSMRVYE